MTKLDGGLFVPVYISLLGHRKIRRLRRLLGVSERAARGLMIELWIHLLAQSPDGSLEGWTDQDIADAAGWDGDPGVLLPAMVTAELVDQDDDGGESRIHDWKAGHLGISKRRASDRVRQRRARERARLGEEMSRDNRDCHNGVTNVTPEKRREERDSDSERDSERDSDSESENTKTNHLDVTKDTDRDGVAIVRLGKATAKWEYGDDLSKPMHFVAICNHTGDPSTNLSGNARGWTKAILDGGAVPEWEYEAALSKTSRPNPGLLAKIILDNRLDAAAADTGPAPPLRVDSGLQDLPTVVGSKKEEKP